MQKKIIIFIVLMLSTGGSLYSQDFVNKDIKQYLVSVGEMQEGSRVSYYAFELIKSDTLNDSDSCGIYRIGVHASHSFTHLLLMDKQKKIFLDCQTDLCKTLSVVLDYFEVSRCRFTDSEKLSYIREVVDVFRRNATASSW